MPIGALVAVPELQAEGPARLLARKVKDAQIRFLATGAEMTLEERRVVRYCLLPGTRVRLRQGGTDEVGGEILALPVARDPASSLMVYKVRVADGAERSVREDALTAVLPPRDAEEQLVTAAFHDLRPTFAPAGSQLPPEPWGAMSFGAREELLAWRDAAWSASGGVIGLAGARVRPLPHQLITARRVLSDRQVRFLLADEVGLGKTIEAGLIMQSLLAMRPDLRVLVVVPGALISQWFLELFVKFGGRRFLMLDHERLRGYAGNPWKDEQFVLASARAIEELEPKNALRFAQSSWDLAIVDECHRMQPGGVLYKRISVLSKGTPHVLLLSATPARQHADAYLALLALLQPQAYRPDDLAAFTVKLKAHDQVVELLARTRDATPADAPALGTAWQELFAADPLLAGLGAALAAATGAGVEAARAALIAYVREHHQLDHRIIRHRRSVLARLSQASGVKGLDLSQRSGERVPYSPDPAERAVRERLAAYRSALVGHFAAAPTGKGGKGNADGAIGELPPRLSHWLLQLELSAGADPLVLERMLAMRAAVLEDADAYSDYRARAAKGETAAQVLRSDLSENEIAAHIAVSASCHADPAIEGGALTALREEVAQWQGSTPARAKALIRRLTAFWAENPQEKVLIFTGHGLAVKRLASYLAAAFGEDGIETFGAHQDTIEREEAARRFRDDDDCPILVCDPLGGEGRNFQFVSVVVHHDLPWSLAAVEQRIGRVDRIGRDGEVASWLMVADDGECLESAWAEVLEESVRVFSTSSSGLEFVSDALETRALAVALSQGAAGLRAIRPELDALVAGERDQRDARSDELFHEEAGAYAEAAALASALEAFSAPRDAVCRWIRGMGGSARRDEEPPRAFHLRTRYHQEPEAGVFSRETALDRPALSYFSIGNGVIDRLLDDAGKALWCSAAAWRRQSDAQLKKWEGVRIGYQLVLDLMPLANAGVPLDCLRRLLVVAPPRRLVRWVRGADGVIEQDAAALAALDPVFDPRRGDRALSLSGSREVWTRPLLSGKVEQLVEWQDQVRRAVAAARVDAERLLPQERDQALAAFSARAAEGVGVARAQAASARARFGEAHPEARLAEREAEEEERQATALRAALAGARLEVVSLAYVVVA
jgi:ATP-dependent helicase HepA